MSNLESIFSQHDNWPEVKKIILILNKNGFKAYLAGGCVRDALLNRTPKDFDIATSARSEEVSRLFPHSNIQGKAFGVVAIFCSKGPVEVATFRKDGPYTDGRHPQYVEFLSDKEDALRRDFTVNALFYDIKTNKIIDYVGGLKDLKRKIIKTVGNPTERFQEDHLRILRALRFSIKLDFEIEEQTKNTLFKMKDKLLKISRERIYEECLKILKTRKFKKSLSAFKDLNLLNHFLFPLTSLSDKKKFISSEKKPTEKKSVEKQSTEFFLLQDSKKNINFVNQTKKNIKQINWEFCLEFWNQVVSFELMNKKSFLWIFSFFPILIQMIDKKAYAQENTTQTNEKKDNSLKIPSFKIPLTQNKKPEETKKPDLEILNQAIYQDILTKEGKWNHNFKNNLKEWKFPLNLIREVNEIFYSSCCILGLKKASLGKKLRMLNSDFSQSILFLCKNQLRAKKWYLDKHLDKHSEHKLSAPAEEKKQKKNQSVNIDIIDILEKEFISRAPKGKLPDPLINGNDLKALGLPEDENMARILENLYDKQLESKITEKQILLKLIT